MFLVHVVPRINATFFLKDPMRVRHERGFSRSNQSMILVIDTLPITVLSNLRQKFRGE